MSPAAQTSASDLSTDDQGSTPLMSQTRHVHDLPRKRILPIVELAQWGLGQHRFFNDRVAELGSPFRVRFPFIYPKGIVVFSSPAAAKELLRLPAHVAHAGEAYGLLRQSTGPSAVIVLDEDEHLRLRKLVLPPLHGKRLARWEQFARERTLEDIEGWPVGEPFALRATTERITMSVIAKIVFGVRDPARMVELQGLLPTLFDLPLAVGLGYVTPLGRIDLGPRSPWGRYRRRRDRIDELIYAEIAERRAEHAEEGSEERADLLSMLLESRDEDGRQMSDEELRDQLVTMLVAGHETTATSIAWALERLLRTPAVLDTLLASLRAGETEYLDAVIKETMRIRPVVAQIGRLVKEDIVIDGYQVPVGTMVIVPMTVIHRDPDLYPEPDEFRPERFLDGNDPGGYAWLPFGGGTRRCPGASLALLEMRVVLATVLQTVTLQADRWEPEKPVVRGITVVPSRGGRVVMTARRPATEAVPGPPPVLA